MPRYARVACLAELPDDTGMLVTVGDQEIALFRVGDEVFALDNECPHKQGPICEGELEDDVVTCPWHAWQISVRTGEVVYNPRLRSRTFSCKVTDGEVFVEVEEP